ncbi:uncharacterized protein LOC142775992 [Rhipicephalus microplus]|uniref:uncharacterized protein LOC142775992 n=1 Tax=Rhipicephalus microplus TaxID=6941 RepID=UPI003F6B7CA6
MTDPPIRKGPRQSVPFSQCSSRRPRQLPNTSKACDTKATIDELDKGKLSEQLRGGQFPQKATFEKPEKREDAVQPKGGRSPPNFSLENFEKRDSEKRDHPERPRSRRPPQKPTFAVNERRGQSERPRGGRGSQQKATFNQTEQRDNLEQPKRGRSSQKHSLEEPERRSQSERPKGGRPTQKVTFQEPAKRGNRHRPRGGRSLQKATLETTQKGNHEEQPKPGRSPRNVRFEGSETRGHTEQPKAGPSSQKMPFKDPEKGNTPGRLRRGRASEKATFEETEKACHSERRRGGRGGRRRKGRGRGFYRGNHGFSETGRTGILYPPMPRPVAKMGTQLLVTDTWISPLYDMVQCPYDASHLIPAGAQGSHIRRCPSRRNCASTRYYRGANLPMDENWETDVLPGTAGYTPPENLDIPGFREVQTLTPKQKRDYYTILLTQHRSDDDASPEDGSSEKAEEPTIASATTGNTPTGLSQSSSEDSQCQNNELLPVTPAQRVSVNVNTVQSNTKKSSIEPVPRLPASTTSLAVTQPEPTNACAQNKTEPQNLTLPANQSVRELSVLENLPPPNLSEIANVRKPVDVNNQEPSNLAEHAQLPEPEKLFEATKTQTSHNTPARNPDLELRAPAKLLVLAKPEVSADVPLAKRQEPAHDSAPAKRVAPVKIQPPVSLVASANLPKPRKEPTPSLSAPDKRQAYIRLAEPENMPKPGNMLAANIKTPAKLQARVSLVVPKNLSIPESTSAPDSKAPAKLQARVSLATPTKKLNPGNTVTPIVKAPAKNQAFISSATPTKKVKPENMETPFVKAPAKVEARVSLAAPANLPKSENLRAANNKPRSNHQIYISLRKPKLHEPANTPTPIIPTSPSVEALNITETRTLMEPREFLTTAKLPMSVDMKAPNVSSHSRVKVNKNLPTKVLVQASVSANLPTQNLTKPGNHLVPTEMPKPTNLSAPNLPLGINIPTSKSPLVAEELLASTNVQENLRAANITPRSNHQIYIRLRKPKLHEPANTPTPIIPTSPSVEALNIRETRTLMEPREFLTTAKLPMSVGMKAPNVSSHSRVKVNKNLPAKVLVQASVSANLPTQNLTKPGNHLVPTEMPKPANLPAPNLPLGINIPTSKSPLLPEELVASTNVQERYAPEREDSQVLETLAKPTSNHPVPTDNTSTVNLLSSKKVQETRSVQPLNISESGITPATAHAIMTINLSKSSSLPEPTNRLPHNFPAPTDLLASEKLPAFMNTPVLSIPEPINVSAAPANLPKSENMRAANIKPRSNHQIYIRLRKPKLHKPANTPTPIIPTSPSVEALNITETRTLMEPREFLTTAKLPMSVDMKAPNVSSHSRVKVSKNLPAKVPVQASVSANLPTQNLTKPGNHLVPTEMPKPTNLSAPNHPLGINIPTSKSPLVPEELLASTNVQENLRAANIKPRSNRPIYISLRKPSALSNLPAHKNFPALAEVLAEVNLVAPLTGIPLLSSAGQANRSVSVNPPTSSQQPQMNTLASKSLVELASMPRHEHFLAPNFPNTMSQPLNLYVPESPAKPTDQPATRLQVTTNLPEPASIPIGQLASLASDLDAPVREQQSPNLDTFYDPYTYEASYQAAGRGAPVRNRPTCECIIERDDDGNVCYQFGRGRRLF